MIQNPVIFNCLWDCVCTKVALSDTGKTWLPGMEGRSGLFKWRQNNTEINRPISLMILEVIENGVYNIDCHLTWLQQRALSMFILD